MPNCADHLGKRRAKRSRKVPDGPPQKRSPAVPASTNGANRKSKFVSQKDNTKSAQKSQEIERHFFYVTHGQTNAGFIEQVDQTYRAIAPDERIIGTFNSIKAAADAVSAAFKVA
jgi:hypothetical protein